ncbi:MAG: hypothetical protein H6828_10885 [Planctomycetes bacterium]|nr:hypothetical protein [Planctomycetota bacterium]
MTRLVTSLVLLVTLLLGPALCHGGVLEHECGCDEGVGASCSHEDGCADDPCADFMVPGSREELEAPLRALLPPAPLRWPAPLAPAPCADVRRAHPPAPPDRDALPYATSDRPPRR